jgi:hypothetical protein
MAIGLLSRHRFWAALLTIAGAMSATAGLSAHEMADKGRSAVGGGIAQDALNTRSVESPILYKCRLLTAARLVSCAATRVRTTRYADPSTVPDAADQSHASQPGDRTPDSEPSRVGLDAQPCGARLHGGWTLRPGKRTRLRFDAEEWEDRVDGDDDAHVPVGAWFRDMVRCLHDLTAQDGCPRFAPAEPPSAPSPFLQPLRC